MKMYVYGESKLEVGYIPDWIIFENDNEAWTFDIQGDIDYDPNRLNCRIKGELIPWILVRDGYEITLDDAELSEERFDEIFKNANNIVIGIYPCRNEDIYLMETDKITDCECKMLYGNKEYEFKFDVETY